MITERETIKCEAVFNVERTHRFLLKRIWDKSKPLATVIMLNPCDADALLADTTTYLVVNNVARLEEFGGVIIVNLYSLLTSKLILKWSPNEELSLGENDDYIKKASEDASKIILAWGRGVDSNKRLAERAMQVLNNLMPYKEKLFVISDGERVGLHPLTPSIRNGWTLLTLDEASAMQKELEQKKLAKKVVAKAEESEEAKVAGNEFLETVADEVAESEVQQ